MDGCELDRSKSSKLKPFKRFEVHNNLYFIVNFAPLEQECRLVKPLSAVSDFPSWRRSLEQWLDRSGIMSIFSTVQPETYSTDANAKALSLLKHTISCQQILAMISDEENRSHPTPSQLLQMLDREFGSDSYRQASKLAQQLCCTQFDQRFTSADIGRTLRMMCLKYSQLLSLLCESDAMASCTDIDIQSLEQIIILKLYTMFVESPFPSLHAEAANLKESGVLDWNRLSSLFASSDGDTRASVSDESTRPVYHRRLSSVVCYTCHETGHKSYNCPSSGKKPKYSY